MSTILGFLLGNKYEKSNPEEKKKIIAWLIIILLLIIALTEFFIQELFITGALLLICAILYFKFIKE